MTDPAREFETRDIACPTRQAAESPTMQLDDDEAWSGFAGARLA